MKKIHRYGMKADAFLPNNKKNTLGRHIRLLSVALALLLWGLSTHASAAAVTLAWDANLPDPDGYRVFHRTSGQSYDFSSSDCRTTGTSCTINNLAPNTTYHFIVRAYVGNDVSGDSNEASHTTTAPGPSDNTISASAGPHGNITPSGEVSVSAGGNQLFNITANTGCHISDVRVNGQSVGPVSSYEFTDITTDHNIEAIFEQSNQDPSPNSGPDQTMVDTDDDGYSDNNDAFPEDSTEWLDSDADGVGDNSDDDDDGDGMADSWEDQNGLDPLDPDDADLDPDGDGLTNQIEDQGGTDPNQAEAPGDWAPWVITPSDGLTDASMSSPAIEIDTKDRPDKDATIKQTLWQILSEDEQTVIFNIISDVHLTRIRIPRLILDPETAYVCRARCYDSNNQISDWSQITRFITERIANDSDLNGVPDDLEVSIGSPPQPTEDLPSNHSLAQKTGIIFVDLNSDNENASLTSAMYVELAEIEKTPEEPLPTPFAMVANKVLTNPGEKVTLQFIFEAEQTPSALQWVKYDAVNGWQDFSQNARLEDNGRTMDITVKDGGDGDADGMANGVIINLSGPATVAAQTDDTPTASTDSGGQCFIQSLCR